MKIEPVYLEPALIIKNNKEKILVIADTHIGIEYKFLDAGFRIPSQSEKIIDNVLGICQKEKPHRLVHLGDLKHNIPRTFFHEKNAVMDFIDKILQVCNMVDIVLGNHDGQLSEMLEKFGENVIIRSSRGFTIGDCGFIHGHTWPTKEVLESRYLVMSHIHPAIRLVDTLGRGETERCWVRSKVNNEKLRMNYNIKNKNRTEVYIVPAFNELCGSPLNIKNKKGLGPLIRNDVVDIENAEIYLLNGTCIGKLSKLPLLNTT